MAKREKRLKKQYEGLLKQIEKHKQKIKTYKGYKDTTHNYWLKEIEVFEKIAKERSKLLKKLRKKKKS
ncbi:hypothetical protein CL622_06775 [archaeon]|nr:hypothetical protein [archaeon]